MGRAVPCGPPYRVRLDEGPAGAVAYAAERDFAIEGPAGRSSVVRAALRSDSVLDPHELGWMHITAPPQRPLRGAFVVP